MIIAFQTLLYYRQSLLAVIERALRPYYKRLALAFSRNGEDSEEEDSDDQVFSDYDEEKGVVFYPPVYAQRYAAVSDCLIDERWRGKLEKVVDFGYHDMSFIKYLKEVPGIRRILGVDLESIPLKCSSDVFDDYTPKRENPLHISLFQGNAADPDYRLIGCDAVIAIEMIEHMLPHDLDRFLHTVFGFIKPWIVVFTTPNGDFNVLFKALEKNGLRRLDHFFEWSREQFNDWCSNIVVRYPIYTVTCKGIGPGPPGTLHYGCCSQLALFINKDYHKQQDLNLNSLALVPRQSPQPLNDLYDSWDSSEQDMEAIGPPTGMVSFTDLLCNDSKSQLTFVVSPSLSTCLPFYAICPEEILSNSDKTLQCNLDTEIAKSFMFDEDQYFNIRIPRRRNNNRVYVIEDVASRLNCSTFQVKKFSKMTQNLMAKNKIDTLIHTREVVDEIRHLTKTLNFNKCIMNEPDGINIWCNINWGDNAPYWNEYYKVVREYNFPFETKSEECRILDLVSDEINRIIDTQFNEDMSCDANHVEIPLNYLMTVIEHITDDVDKVRDILQWNGYEIVNDVVIHSRLVVDTASVETHENEWHDNDTLSDWDNVTEIQSTTVSESSMVELDYYEHRLRHALDQKVRNLRVMLTADEDITTELDKVVCKLMKLALRTSKELSTAPPAKWMQCKLLDLLTLTEKTIERRKKFYIENSLKAIEFHAINDKLQHVANFNNIKEDPVTNEIVNKYRHIISLSDTTIDDTKYQYNELEDGLLNITSLGYFDEHSPSPVTISSVPTASSVIKTSSQTLMEQKCLELMKPLLNLDSEDTFRKNELDNKCNNFGDTQTVTSLEQKENGSKDMKEIKTKVCKISPSVNSFNKCKSKREDRKNKTSSTRVTKKVSRKVSGNYSLVRNPTSKYRIECDSYIARSKRRSKENRSLTMRATKPIPESLIDLCHPELKTRRGIKGFNIINVDETNDFEILNKSAVVLDIKHNTLHRSIGTDSVEGESFNCIYDDQDQVNKDVDLNLFTKHEVSTENIDSQTIFLNDINEPSTSKGIRHNLSTDVQCGPDTLAAYPMLSASTSFVRIPPVFNAGLKILDENSPIKMDRTEFGTSTQTSENYNEITHKSKSIGIKIKDSDMNINTTIIDTHVIQGTLQNKTSSIQSFQSLELESNLNSPDKGVLYFSQQELISSQSFTLKLDDTKACADITPAPSVNIDTFFKSESKLNSTVSKDNESTLTDNSEVEFRCKPILSCGGVHVHSYKDNLQCEDIIFQGQWQQSRPKSVKKKIHSSIVAKKINEPCIRKQKNILKEKRVVTKDKITVKKPVKAELVIKTKKPMQVGNFKLYKAKQDATSYELIKFKPIVTNKFKASNTIRSHRSVNNVTKVASKIGMSANSSKNVKSAFTTKKLQISFDSGKRKDRIHHNQKSIPVNMNKECAKVINKSNSLVSTDTNSKIKKSDLNKEIMNTVRTKTKEISKDFVKFCGKSPKATYIVYRNDKQEDSTDGKSPVNPKSTKDLRKENIRCTNHAFSSSSLNSSTCSSPNSISTVRTVTIKSKNPSYTKCTSSSHKISSESEKSTPSKGKRVFKRYKSKMKSDNKENIPITTNKLTSKKIKESQTTSRTFSKHQVITKSNMEVSDPEYYVDTNLSFNTSLLRKRSFKSSISSINNNMIPSPDIISCNSWDCDNMVLVVQPPAKLTRQVCQKIVDDMVNTEGKSLLTDYLLESNIDSDHSRNFIRQLIEELIEAIDFSNLVYATNINSRLFGELDFTESSSSFKTVTADSLNNTLEDSDIESSLNHTYGNLLIADEVVSGLVNTKFNIISSKSITPVSNRSEYFLADSELKTGVALVEQTQTSTHSFVQSTITDIYERKEHHLIQAPLGALSFQAFSGFSLNGESATGDQPDPVSVIDSETGSLAIDVARLTESEELLISGRSSDSYESCVIEEDAVVPNWLFQIISRQQSVEEEQVPVIGPQPEPIPQPVYDVNGNPIETGIMRVAAGAGDGRGIHSDPSQDSSGRGTTTSVSSSDTSSSSQSEDIVVDPSAFTNQIEVLRGGLIVPVTETSVENPIAESSRSLFEPTLVAVTCSSHELTQPMLNAFSDIDADVSSMDTDEN